MKWLLTFAICLSAANPAAAADRPLRVVATLSTYADLARMIGGDRVAVSAVASPRFNPHFIEPKPSDVVRVKQADLLIHSGLDLELWRGPLLDAAGNRDVMPGGPKELDLSRGIPLLEVPTQALSRAEGDIHLYGNPHYWLDPVNGGRIAQAICDKLSAMDAAHAPEYRQRLEQFQSRLDQKTATWRARLAPFQGRRLIGYHNEWVYLMAFSGLTMDLFLEPKPGIPPTPQHVQALEQRIRDERLPAIVQATYYPRETADALARRTGVRVVLLCQNVGELPACSDYLAMLDYDVAQLAEALGAPASE